MTSLPATGERTAPGLPDEGYWFARHEAAYAWIATRLDPGSRVVDAGAGEGYGAELLRAGGAHVVALEYDVPASAHMRASYPDVSVATANLAAMPLRSGNVDAIVSLQVIEHLWDLPAFLADCRRALAPGGRLIVTTPNRLTFSPGLDRGEKPVNPFHVEEFDADQVRELLHHAGFGEVALHGLRHGRRLADHESTQGPLVAAQVRAAISGQWPAGLQDFIATVTAADFVIDDDALPEGDPRLDSAQDLLAIAWAPA